MKPILKTEKGVCYLCGTEGYTHKHHVFDGANRKLSEKNGLYVYLCPYCHTLGKEAVHNDIETMRQIQREGQQDFEEKIGTRELFMRTFGRNYL